MAGRYARATTVSATDSRADLERVLLRYGADAFGYGFEGLKATVIFRIAERHYRIGVPLPDKNAQEFKYTAVKRYLRSPQDQQAEYDQAVRQRWRALLLIVKAKLEAVDLGITTVEREFLADTMLPDGQTVGEWVEPQVTEVYRSGRMPALMPVQWRALPPGRDAEAV